MAWTDFLGGLIKPITNAYGKNQDRKAQKEAGHRAVESQIISGAHEVKMSIQQWEAMSLKGNEDSWKDEVTTLVFLTPIVTIMFGGVYGGITGNTDIMNGMVKAIETLNQIDGNFGMMMTAVVYAAIGIQFGTKMFKR